jgi:hypothetical protein
LLKNGMGIYLPEAKPCQCGETQKLITRDAAICPNPGCVKRRGETVYGRLNCLTGEITEMGRK